MKKIKYLLQKWDGIWSVALTFLGFYLIGLILSNVFGLAVGTYDPGFIQPLLLAAAVVIGATNFAVLGLYFTFRGIHNYIYGSIKNGSIINKSKEDWGSISATNRFIITLSIIAFFILAIVLVYIQLI